MGARKMDTSAVEAALSSLRMVISRPAALFDLSVAIAELDEVVIYSYERQEG